MAHTRGPFQATALQWTCIHCPDPPAFPWLERSWNLTGIVPNASWQDKARDDFAGRLFVFFESPGGPFTFVRTFMMKLGGGLPGRALNYVWADSVDTGQVPRREAREPGVALMGGRQLCWRR
jgi:hypothetical protein